MARYAEWNKFIRNLRTDKYGETTVNEVGIAFEKAATDVVPKNEISREIFEQFKTEILSMIERDELLAEYGDEFFEGRINAFHIAIDVLDKLTTKYVEGAE